MIEAQVRATEMLVAACRRDTRALDRLACEADTPGTEDEFRARVACGVSSLLMLVETLALRIEALGSVLTPTPTPGQVADAEGRINERLENGS